MGVIGAAIEVPRDVDRRAMEQYTALVQREMLRLTDLAEDWAVRLRKSSRAPGPEISPFPELRKSA